MAATDINILLTSFSGLGLPPTLSILVPRDSSISEVCTSVLARLPPVQSRLILTTNSNRQLLACSTEPITSLLPSPEVRLLPLRLSAPLCGGKGGFGSQLRAAGGRMSSRKKRKPGEEVNGSSRNLDGRRIRTVTEAKALAEYLAIKPEMDKKEKEERRKRWESIVEMSEKREEEIRNGRGRLDGKWVESKEEASEKTREAVLASIKAGDIKDVLGMKESDSSAEASGASEESDSEMEVDEANGTAAAASSSKSTKPQPAARSFFGWDEDLEDSSEDDDDDESEPAPADAKGKGKGKAVS